MRSYTKRSPWLFVPSLYFQQGIPVILVQQASVFLYKRMGIANDQIALWTSLISWPWILRLLWSPVVDLKSTKRNWIILTHVGVIFALLAVAWSLSSHSFLVLSLGFFLTVAFISATNDTAVDGFYLAALEKEDQAFFVGIRSTFFRLAMIFCNGALVILAGYWERSGIPVYRSWQMAIGVGVGVYVLCWLYAIWAMPHPALDRPVKMEKEAARFSEFTVALKSFFTQRGIGAIVCFFLFFRFAESMQTKISGLFLLDPRGAGGLGMDTVQAGAILGSFGIISLVAGGVLGGWVIAKQGLRPWLWPLAVMMAIPNLLYVWAAKVQPGPASLSVITVIEQFTYGLGMAAYMVYAVEISRRSRYRTSHYAIIAALIAMGAMIAGSITGFLQVHFGYFGLFVLICFSTIPGMITLRYIPLEEGEVERELIPAGLD